MYCKNCSAQIDDDSTFCTQCGINQTESETIIESSLSQNISKKDGRNGDVKYNIIFLVVSILISTFYFSHCYNYIDKAKNSIDEFGETIDMINRSREDYTKEYESRNENSYYSIDKLENRLQTSNFILVSYQFNASMHLYKINNYALLLSRSILYVVHFLTVFVLYWIMISIRRRNITSRNKKITS